MQSRQVSKNGKESLPVSANRRSIFKQQFFKLSMYVLRYVLIFLPLTLIFFHTVAVFMSRERAELLYASIHNESPIEIYDRDGVLITKVYDSLTQVDYVTLDEVSDYYLDLVIVTEDKDFYKNRGVDYKRTLKCTVLYFTNHDRCGGSTITQQLVKLVMLEDELEGQDKLVNNYDTQSSFADISAKYNEILLASWLTKLSSKDEILENYINRLNFANGRYGIEAAAQGYFGISASELDISQSAFLAGIPNSPTKFDPYTNFDAAKSRQELILQLAYEQGKISSVEYEFSKNSKISLENNYISTYAPHFLAQIDYDSIFYDDVDNRRIETSLSLELYNKTRDIVSGTLSELKKEGATNAAVVVIDAKSGEVLTLLGSGNYWSGKEGATVNHATALRQPGSTFKPFVYALGIEQGLTASSLISDTDRVFESSGGPYIPTNYDQKYHGDVTLRTALANSLNIPAVAVQEFVTPLETYNLADKIGLTEIRSQKPDLSAALGGFSVSLLDLTNAYRVFPNNGVYFGVPEFLLGEDSLPKPADQVFGKSSDGVAYVITDVLSDSDARRLLFGSYNNLTLPFTASVKTGTSQDYRDSWTIGYTGEFVVGVWVGNSDNSSTEEVAGIEGAASIWHDVMIETYNYYKIEKCTKFCDFLIEKPVYLYDTNTFTPAEHKVLGPI